MKIQAIHLHNWQPYYGQGASAKKIQFDGKSGKINAIIYGQNTHGKTALWQSLQFAFYGKVNKRKTGWEEKKFKPIIGTETAKEPLLNVSALEAGEFLVGVYVYFDHGGKEYELARTFDARDGGSTPKTDGQMKLKLDIRKVTDGGFEKKPEDFIREILPYKLAQFFMFDGERLDEYRKLFEDTNDVKLKGYIEEILRLPVLTDGVYDFGILKKDENKLIRKYVSSSSKDEEKKAQIKEINGYIDEIRPIIKENEGILQELEDRLREVSIDLETKDKGKLALEQERIYGGQKDTLESEIEDLKASVAAALPNTWRCLISKKISRRLESLDKDIIRQKMETEKIGVLKGDIETLDSKVSGDPCRACGHSHSKPTQKEADKWLAKIVNLQKEIENLEKSRIDPEPRYLENRKSDLLKIKTDLTLDNLISWEKALKKKMADLRRAGKLYDAAKKLLSKDARLEVQNLLDEKETLTKKSGALSERIEENGKDLTEYENLIEKILDEISDASSGKTIAHKKAEKKVEIIEELGKAWASVTDSHREKMRIVVETQASKVFMGLTNKAKSYKGLEISKQFQISILNISGKKEAGSSGQSALVAYSVLDALTSCSGIEFPLIIDTPGRSIDEDHIKKLFDYLMDCGKQVILLPEGTELKPDVGDASYGHRCAATYELKLDPANEDLTIINTREKDLRKVH